MSNDNWHNLVMAGLKSADASAKLRPTEAQLRWAQFHHKRRAQGVKLVISRIYQTPLNLEDVSGAYPEDGNSTTSVSEVEIRQHRPKVSRGHRALLRVSKRDFIRRSKEIENHGFRRLQGSETFSDGEDDDDLNEIFMTRRRRPRKRRGGDVERVKRFEAACHAMMMSVAQPEEILVIPIPTKRWIRSADHIAASALLEEEYVDPKWGIRRQALSRTPQGIDNQFNLHHHAMMPSDRGASWLVHVPNAIPASRVNPSSNFYITDRSRLPEGTKISDGVSEGGETVSTLAMRAPGQKKFKQLVALAQQRLIERNIGRWNQSHTKEGGKSMHLSQFNATSPSDEVQSASTQPLYQFSPAKPKKSYMPRMRVRDFSPDSEIEIEFIDDELNAEELKALNQIPKNNRLYLEALQNEKETERRLSRTQELTLSFDTGKKRDKASRTKEIARNFEDFKPPRMRLREYDDLRIEEEEEDGPDQELQPEELAVMQNVVSTHLAEFDIATFEDRNKSLERADEILVMYESEQGEHQVNHLRQLFSSLRGSGRRPNDIDEELREERNGVQAGKVMAMQQIIRSRIEELEGMGSVEVKKRLNRAQELVRVFEPENKDKSISKARHLVNSFEKPQMPRMRLKDLSFRENINKDLDFQPEELITMQHRIDMHLENEFKLQSDSERNWTLDKAEEIVAVFKSHPKQQTTNAIRELFDTFEANYLSDSFVGQQGSEHDKPSESLRLEEVIVMRQMIRSRLEEFESGDNVEKKKRLTRAKMIAQIFEAENKNHEISKIQQVVKSLERGRTPNMKKKHFTSGGQEVKKFHNLGKNANDQVSRNALGRESDFFEHVRHTNAGSANATGSIEDDGNLHPFQQQSTKNEYHTGHFKKETDNFESTRQVNSDKSSIPVISRITNFFDGRSHEIDVEDANRIVKNERQSDFFESVRQMNSDKGNDVNGTEQHPSPSDPSGDSAINELWNIGRSIGLNSLASTLNPQSGAAVSVSERVNYFFQNAISEPNQQTSTTQTARNLNESASLSERVQFFVNKSASKSVEESNAAPLPGDLNGAAANMSERVGGFFQNIINQQEDTLPSENINMTSKNIADKIQNSISQDDSNGQNKDSFLERRPQHDSDEIISAPTPRLRTQKASDSDDSYQPIPPKRSKVEQEIFDAVEASTPKRNKEEEYIPDEFDADFLAAYRKKRESITPADDASSASSFKALPSGFREVVKRYSPTRKSHGTSPSRNMSQKKNSSKNSTLSAENIKKISNHSPPMHGFDQETFGQGIIDTDGTTSEASNYGMNPQVLSSLMLSPDLLTKRHLQAVRAIERQQWDDVIK
jgi:hypothetical protein